MINQMCRCFSHCLNETPLGLRSPGPLGPTGSPQLKLSANAEAASSSRKHGRLHGEGRASVAH